MKYKIAVAGASHITHCCNNIKQISKEVGKEIVKQRAILVTGATTGAPYYAAQGAKSENGMSIGFSPAVSELEHKKVYRLPLDYFDVMIYTGFDYSGRNLLMTRAADGVIIICGRMGTLNEFTIAFEDKKPIAVLAGSGGTADIIKTLLSRPHRPGEKIIFEPDPKKLVEHLIKHISQLKKVKVGKK